MAERIDVEKLFLTPGRLLVRPHEKNRNEAGFEVSESGREVSSAEVVKCGDLPESYQGIKPGTTIIYERLNSEPYQFELNGSVITLRFVLIRDVAAWEVRDV